MRLMQRYQHSQLGRGSSTGSPSTSLLCFIEYEIDTQVKQRARRRRRASNRISGQQIQLADAV
jgi:hypothetical protein